LLSITCRQGEGTTRYTVLGRLRAERAGSELPLSTLRQRVVLAVLVLRRGHLVTPDDLAHAVWGGSVPASADNLVRIYVARLRRVLASVGRGHLLHDAPGRCDLDTFAELLRPPAGLACGWDIETRFRAPSSRTLSAARPVVRTWLFRYWPSSGGSTRLASS
jgi:hypothetical protein